MWKLADFGLLSKGTSVGTQKTEYARGTVCYRAPEILAEHERIYNNKVDIWALGCILYELAVHTSRFPHCRLSSFRDPVENRR